MNVLQIVPELHSGGVERGTVDFAKYLVSQGHRSVIVSAGGPLVGDLINSGVVHYHMAVHKKSLFSILSCSHQLKKILKKEKIDIIHARSRVPAWIAHFAARSERIPLVTTCHGVYNTHFMSRIMSWGKIVIAISHAVSIHMKERFNVPYHRLRLIHRGVNLNEFQRHKRPGSYKDSYTVAILGRITPIKGHAILLKAMARVLRSVRKVKLIVIGTPSKQRYLDEIEMLTRRLGIEDHVEFLGIRYDVPEILRRTDLLVAPAVGEEAFGRVIIEAGACGVPVIASRIGGIVDVIDDRVDGVLVPASDAASLAEAITEVLRNRTWARSLADNLRKKVEEKFNDQIMFEKTVDVYREAVEKPKILIFKMRALGDVILSIPSIRAIRKKFPHAHLTALVEKSARPILRNCPYLDDVITIEEDRGFGRLFKIFRLGRLLRREYFDISIDLQNNRTSHMLAYLSGARTRAGYSNGKFSFLLNSTVKDSGVPMSPVDHQFQVLKLLGINELDRKLEIWTKLEDQERVASFLKDQWVRKEQILIGIHPTASKKWPTKQWPFERFAELADRLSKRNVRVVLIGDKSSEKIGENIVKLCKSKPVNAIGKTSVGELIALIKVCAAFVTSDSAPMHIAATLGTPFVALFGPTDPRRHLMRSDNSKVIKKDLHCSACYLRKCPVGHGCMKKISVDEVFDGVLSFFETPSESFVEV